MADILGFGADGTLVSLATGGGHFASPLFQLSTFSANAGGWTSDNTYPRHLADITADAKADIIGFAANGVLDCSVLDVNGHTDRTSRRATR